MIGILRGDPFVKAHVRFINIAVIFLDKLTLYAKISREFLIGSMKEVFSDLFHVNVPHLHLFFGDDAVPAGDSSRLSTGAAARRGACADAVRHSLTRHDQGQIPVVIEGGKILFLYIVPVGPPGAQVDVIAVFILAALIIALYVDHIGVIHQARVYNPVRVLQFNVREKASLGHHGPILAGSGFTEADRRGNHRLRFRVVLVPKGDGTHIVLTNVNGAADVPPLAFHVFVITSAAGHDPPAVPVAVPPVKQGAIIWYRVIRGFAGLWGAGGFHPAERRRVNGDFPVFAADHLFEGHFHLAGCVLQHVGYLYFQRRSRIHLFKLVVIYHFIVIIVRVNDGGF